MRHGPRASTIPPSKVANNPRLGCYYCNDIVAPKDVRPFRLVPCLSHRASPSLVSYRSDTRPNVYCYSSGARAYSRIHRRRATRLRLATSRWVTDRITFRSHCMLT